MKKLVLTVFIKNKEYAKALMRGLSMESPGIEVKRLILSELSLIHI